MNILLLGGGGREHALADKLVSSLHCDQLYIAPGNAGTALLGQNLEVDIRDFEAIKTIVQTSAIGLVIVGPEAPLVEGIVDFFVKDDFLKNIPIIGPTKQGAMLEGSKDFAKAFMLRHQIPTASYRSFDKTELDQAILYLENHSTPIVLKADGLAAGKGVVIVEAKAEAILRPANPHPRATAQQPEAEARAKAKAEVQQMLSGKFGKASEKVVIEQFLKGIEFSIFVLTDGNDYVLLPEAKDYKRIGEGDTGPNTGGMGAVSPVPFVDDALWKKVKARIIEPTIKGLREEKIPYKGFIFFGLILVDDDPYVIEYNCRMGDPETEVVMPRLQSDLVDVLMATWNGTLKDISVLFDDRYAVTIMLVSGGYPGDYEKGKPIHGMDQVDGTRIYHAGTAIKNHALVTAGGRVIAVTSMASSLQKAIDKSLRNAEVISFDGKYFRKDIGRDLL